VSVLSNATLPLPVEPAGRGTALYNKLQKAFCGGA